MDFKGKVVLITGASSGIGAATAIHFSKLSASLVLVGRKQDNVNKIGLYCEKLKGVKPLCIAADVTDDGECERIIRETIEGFSKLDVLVNNVGVSAMGGILNSNMEVYDKVMNVNLRSVFKLTMVAAPHLLTTKGCVINISCTAGEKPNTMTIAYNISKAALDHFTKCVALELAPHGVRVNSIKPSFVRTNLLSDLALSDEQMEMFVMNVVGRTPLKRAVEGNEVAALIEFLASEKAKSITGCCYTIDGGSSLT